MGIDDVRFQAYAQGGQIQAYACPRTRKVLEQRFDYIFRGVDGPKLTYPPILAMNDFPFDLQIGAMQITSWDQEHGNITSRGIRVGSFAYSTDASAIAPQDLEALKGIDTWIVGCIRKEPPSPCTPGPSDRLGRHRATQTALLHPHDRPDGLPKLERRNPRKYGMRLMGRS